MTIINSIGTLARRCPQFPATITLTILAVTATNMETNKEWQVQHIKDLEEDVADCKKATLKAEEEVKDAQEWLRKQELSYAKAIIELHNFRENHD